MELVKGIRITDYCDQNKLTMRERLGLFIQVCHAVQHAHQKGVIHRDIKPHNILVTLHDGAPVPKVVDFGIAKATSGQRLTDKTLFTAFGQFVGTPVYMSPEQAEMSGLDIDTRTDIYALGVLLYELLTGKTPFDARRLHEAALDEVRRIIREEEPPRPSMKINTLDASEQTTIAQKRQSEPPRLIHLVRGDLDWIVMKALEKDRTRRYDTANGLAMDVTRFLDNEPIVARPPSNLYRFQKLVRRNKLAFAAAAAVIVALVLGLGLSTWLFLRERQARHRAVAAEEAQIRLRQQAEADERKAKTEAGKSKQVAQFLEDMLQGVGPSVALGRDTTMLREILDKTVGRIGTDLKDQPEVEIELRLTLGKVYNELQLYKKMEETARETLRLARAHLGEENLAVADELGQLGRALMRLRVLEEAETVTRHAIAMQRKLRGRDSLEEAAALLNLGDVLRDQWRLAGFPDDKGKLTEAEAAIRACLAIRRKRLGNEHPDVAGALASLGLLLQVADKLTEAETASREGLAIRQKQFGDEHPDVGLSLTWLGEVLLSENKLGEAETCLRKALAIQRRMLGNGAWFQAWTLYGLACVLERSGRLDEGESCWREALTIARKQMGDDYPELPDFIFHLARILLKNGKLAEARPLAEEAVAMYRRHPDWPARRREGALNMFSAGLTDLGDFAAARSAQIEVLQSVRARVPANDPELAAALAELTRTLLVSGKFAEAEPLARECLAIREKKLPDDWLTFNAQSMLGDSLLGQKRYAEAEPLLLSGYEGMKQRDSTIPSNGRVRLDQALQRLVQLYEATGRPDQAAEWQKRLAEFDTPAK
jgi:tetratricopeptide (TPR) repeat protein